MYFNKLNIEITLQVHIHYIIIWKWKKKKSKFLFFAFCIFSINHSFERSKEINIHRHIRIYVQAYSPIDPRFTLILCLLKAVYVLANRQRDGEPGTSERRRTIHTQKSDERETEKEREKEREKCTNIFCIIAFIYTRVSTISSFFCIRICD